jgi:predicted DNA-binding transcriptional regulator
MADDAELPADLRAFLYSCIETIEEAQIVMRLQASEGAWPARTIARDLALNDSIARRHLEVLVARGLLQTAVGGEVFYRYAPRSPELQRYTELLVEWWGHSRTAVMRFIATTPRGSMKRFSDAFKLRNRDE